MVNETIINKDDIIADLEELKNKYMCLKDQYQDLEKEYNNLKKDLNTAYDNYDDVNKRWHHTIDEKDIAMKYIEKLLVENDQIGEIVKFYLNYERMGY